MSLSNDQCVRLLAFLLASEISHQNKQKKAKEMLWCLYILVQIPNSGHRWLLCGAVRLQEQVRLGLGRCAGRRRVSAQDSVNGNNGNNRNKAPLRSPS